MPKGDRLKLKADPEDGTTPIANLLLEAVAMAKLSGLQKGAILYLWRKTYGWVDKDGGRKKEAKITLSDWAKALDGNKSHMAKALSDLQGKNIIHRNMNGKWKGYSYSINTDISIWDDKCINKHSLMGHGRICIRCGSNRNIESHHIIPKSEDGNDNEDNKEPRCSACHDYKHAKDKIIKSLEKAHQQKQTHRVAILEQRLNSLEKLNTPELIKERGYYQSWWEYDESLHYLPPYKPIRQINTTQSHFDFVGKTKELNNG